MPNSNQKLGGDPFPVVGIGASAGGLESLERFFANVPIDSGMAFVVIQHLSPDFKSMMDELLARRTNLPIHRTEEGAIVEPNHIYLLPPMKEMIVSAGRLHLTDKDPKQGLTLPIDHFLRSLAQDSAESAVAVILSGTGSDGSRGLVDVHQAGGLVVCESEESAKFDGMPLSAQETGVVDVVLKPEEMPKAILDYFSSPRGVKPGPRPVDAEPLEGVEAVFDLLRREYDIDFSHYKPTTVSRRIERRLSLLHVHNLDDYVERLRQDAEELNALYKDLLIGVTKFFRDPETFELLERNIIPEVLERVPKEDEIRAWVAGCATGEEAYTLAILLHEALGRANRPINVKIFATDVHKSTLESAGHGFFDEERLAEVSPERLRRYFSKTQDGYQITQDLRQLIVFAQHNVLKDAPFTNLDLISCRNLLIYFQPQAQKKALSLFHFGLKTHATLLLGSSESPGDLADEFDTVDEHSKVYRKRRDIRLPADMRLPLSRSANGLRGPLVSIPQPARLALDAARVQVYDLLLDKFMPPSLLVNEDRQLVETFGGGESFLRIKGRRLSADLLDLLDTDAKTSIAGALNRVIRHGTPLSFSGVKLSANGNQQSYRLSIEPLDDRKLEPRHYLITLELLEGAEAATVPVEVDADQMSRDQVQNLEEELDYTKENLQATIEELETSSEEMQATNQELIASNEELQSTNEELHSVNEELYTVNAEHQKKIEELAELNQDIEHLLLSTDVAIIYLDRDLCIRKFTPQVAEIFDLVPEDVGRRIGTFSHRIRYDRLLQDLKEVLETGIRRECDVRDAEGRCFFLRILPYRHHDRTEGVVLSLINISVLDEARGRISHLSSIVESSEDAIIGVSMNGEVTSWNAGAEHLYGYTAEEAIGTHISFIVPEDQRGEAQAWLGRVERGERIDVVEVNRLTRDGKGVHVSLSLSPIKDRLGKVIGASSISRDITHQKLAEQARAYLSAIVASSDDAIISKTLDGVVTSWNRAAEKLYGYSAEEMIGQPITLLVPPERPQEVPEILDRICRGQKVEHVETVRVRKDGARLDISLTVSPIHDANGELIGASAIARDITQLKQVLREKEESEHRIRLLLESTAEAIYGLDREGKCRFANPACCRLLGYDSPDELLGRNMHDLVHHHREDGTKFPMNECPIYGAFLRGERIHCEEEVFWRKDGTHFYVEAWSHPMIDNEGTILGSVVTFLDITVRKETDERLREEARRREQFLAMLSHELRNPLSAIRTATTLLSSPRIDAAADANSRTVVERQTRQMTRLLDDLLDVSRITQDKIALDLEVIDLRKTVGDAVQSVQSLANDCQVGIQSRLPDQSLFINGDVTRLEQIQANLLSNAVKYSPPGEEVLIELLAEQRHALIRVTDNGAGIASDMLPSIFDMFVQSDETLDRTRGGMGVGLTLVRKLVELHEGSISVRSEGSGYGSEFEVRFPLAKPPSKCKPNSRKQKSHETAECVVVIEDQDDNRTLLSTLLEIAGLRVHTAADGAEGLSRVEEHNPDVVIIDIGLPDMDGYEVARRIRSTIGPAIRLIALTGYGQSQDVDQALQAGFDHHLVKPLQIHLLSDLLGVELVKSAAEA